MNDSINSQSDNLADIVGLDAITTAPTISPLWAVFVCLFITILLLVFYRRFIRSPQGQLRSIKQQINDHSLSPRVAAHQIATLDCFQSLNSKQLKQLETLRFSSNEPSKQDVLTFLQHV